MKFAATSLSIVTTRQLAAHLDTARQWDRRYAMIPDVVNYSDYRTVDPADVLGLLARRMAEDRFPCERTIRRWPKGFNDTDYRLLTHVDSLDQIGMRVAVGGSARDIERSLAQHVVAHRSDVTGEAWRSHGIRHGGKLRREQTAARRRLKPTSWMGITDVKSHYPTITPAALTSTLNSIRASPLSIGTITEIMANLQRMPGNISGLPVGLEASGPLGTAGLLPVDRRLTDAGVWFVRLVDDIWVLADSESAASEALDIIADQLMVLGQRENAAKRRVLAPADIDAAVQDADIGYLIAAYKELPVHKSVELVRQGLAEKSPIKVRFGLGALVRAQSPAAIHLLVASDELFRYEPEASGIYLRSIIHKATPLQRELLVGRALVDTDDHGIPGRIRLIEALGAAKLDVALGTSLVELLERTHDDNRLRPLQPYLATAAARSRDPDAWHRAFGAAEDRSNFDLHRAVIATSPVSNRAARAVRHLGRRHPDCRIFAERQAAR